MITKNRLACRKVGVASDSSISITSSENTCSACAELEEVSSASVILAAFFSAWIMEA